MPLSDRVDSPTDQQLLQTLAAGDSRALGLLYDRYASLVYRLAMKMLHNAPEAEDLTQEVFLSLLQRNTYNPERGSLKTYLLTMSHSRSLDRLRTKTRRRSIVQAQRWQLTATTRSSTLTPGEHVSAQELAQQIQEGLAQISAEQRQAIEMAYYQGLSQSEIAAELSLPLGTVKTRVRQGLRKLKQTLGRYVE